MPLILPGNVASATAGGFDVDNSCRFNDGDSAELSISPTSSGNRKTWTLSMWAKRSTLGTYQVLWRANGSGFDDYFSFQNDDTLDWSYNSDGGFYSTNRVFRDIGAWYHFVLRMDSTDGTAGDRQRLYVNGVEETSFSTETNVGQNTDGNTNNSAATHRIGASATSQYFDGYIAEVVLLDGTSAAPTEFGEFDEDSPTIWKPKDVSGLSPGTNGFYLDFKDSSNLGNNAFASGSADFSESNIAAVDQCTDTPTNNFCTMNSLDNYFAAATFSEGNCYIVTNSSNYTWSTGTIALTKGRWYFEMKVVSAAETNWQAVGVADSVSTATNVTLGFPSGSDSWGYFGFAGAGTAPIYSNGADQASASNTYTTNDIIGVFVDLTSNKLYFSKNGTLETGTGWSLTAPASTAYGHYFPAISDYTNIGSATLGMNFGGCPAFALSSAVTDANGYGNFEYDPSYGGAASFDSAAKNFLAICTKNLATDG